MAVPEATKREANRAGYGEWTNVLYEPLARAICARLNAENPRHDASIGLMPDDSWVVWYRPIQYGPNQTGSDR